MMRYCTKNDQGTTGFLKGLKYRETLALGFEPLTIGLQCQRSIHSSMEGALQDICKLNRPICITKNTKTWVVNEVHIFFFYETKCAIFIGNLFIGLTI